MESLVTSSDVVQSIVLPVGPLGPLDVKKLFNIEQVELICIQALSSGPRPVRLTLMRKETWPEESSVLPGQQSLLMLKLPPKGGVKHVWLVDRHGLLMLGADMVVNGQMAVSRQMIVHG